MVNVTVVEWMPPSKEAIQSVSLDVEQAENVGVYISSRKEVWRQLRLRTHRNGSSVFVGTRAYLRLILVTISALNYRRTLGHT